MWRESARYEPAMDAGERERLLGRWAEAVERAGGWAEPRVTARRARVGSGDVGLVPARQMAELKPQRYRETRPAELFQPIHEWSRTHDAGWTYELARMVMTPIALFLYRTRAISTHNVPASGAVHPRAEPLLEHGPLLRRRPRAAEDPVHGEVADVLPQPDPRLHLPRRRRLPGPPRPPRRGGVHHRALDPRPRRLRAHVRRGRALAYASKLGEPKPGVGRLALESGVPVVPVAIHGSQGPCARGSGSSFRRSRSSTASRSASTRVADPDREQQMAASQEIFDQVADDVRGARRAGPRRRDQVAAREAEVVARETPPAALTRSALRPSSSAPGRARGG